MAMAADTLLRLIRVICWKFYTTNMARWIIIFRKRDDKDALVHRVQQEKNNRFVILPNNHHRYTSLAEKHATAIYMRVDCEFEASNNLD